MYDLWEITAVMINLFVVFSVFLLAAVFLGAALVFRTKHAETGIPLVQMPDLGGGDVGPKHYMDTGMFDDDTVDDDDLSPAAQRLREQKAGGIRDQVMDIVTGGGAKSYVED